VRRAYDQYCPVASALDRIGDRWTLLILRDLLWYGPSRFGDFTAHNLGIPPALLAERLRALSETGLVAKEGRRYRAVDPDGQLRSMVDGLAALGTRFLADEDPSDRSLAYLARRMTAIHHDQLVDLTPRSVTLTIGERTVGCTIGGGRIDFSAPRTPVPHIRATREEFMQLVEGTRDPYGLEIEGAEDDWDAADLLRFLSSAA
jgi:DNA-binding HxlR family transcriptional regulator